MSEKIKIRLPDGTLLEYPGGVTGVDVAASIGSGLAKSAIAVKINGELVDLARPLDSDSDLEILTDDSPEGKEILWHSTSHIMAQAVQELFPGTKVTLGPSIADGFYYDFDTVVPFSETDFERIEERMSEIIKGDHKFVRQDMDKDGAIRMFKDKDEKYKVEILSEIEDETVSVYTHNGWTDLCRGPHIPSARKIRAFKLLKVAGSYWRGDENREQLQRIYGTSYTSQKKLDQHLERLEEAKKRDHRKLGKELELFTFHDTSPGAPLWLPNGMVIVRELEQFLREQLDAAEYVETSTPILVKKSLWERSGHWEYYRENMFIVNAGDEVYGLKPMNCPESTYVYNYKMRSYRDLPLRIAEIGRLHRNEISGAVGGLLRVKQLTMDDAHIYVRIDQILEEVCGCMKMIKDFYAVFGFEHKFYFSTKPEKAMGDPQLWIEAESSLRESLDASNVDYEVNEKEGAFYGPKIDVKILDALGRPWQLATIQLDFVLPERFELEYIDKNDQRIRPVVIHRAIFGSFERFIGVLIEHFAGAFPTWLSPTQVVVIPIADRHHEFAATVSRKLKKDKIRVKLDNRAEKMGAKIRESEINKVPYMLIVGDKELENDSVSVRKRHTGDVGIKPLKEFRKLINEEISDRALEHNIN